VVGFVVANDGDITPDTVIQLKIPNLPVVLIESYIEDRLFPVYWVIISWPGIRSPGTCWIWDTQDRYPQRASQVQ
jgi:hypothetical protein